MAEAIVGPLLNKLQEVAVAEAKALAGVSREIDRLRDKLMWLHAVVHETDLRSRHDGNPLVRVLACQMREVAFEAEDAIDRFYLQADLSRRDWRRAAAKFLENFGTHIRVRYELSRKVRSMNARLEDIVDNSTKYSIDHGGSEADGKIIWRASRTIPPVRENWDDSEASEKSEPAKSELTGRQKEEKYLLDMLLREKSGIICVVGESGIGKRALVRSAYANEEVKEHLPVCVWENFPPDSSNTSNIVEQITSELKFECSMLHGPKELDEVRYLLVVDGIMSTTPWNEIRRNLPEGRKGSKIVVIATDKKKVDLYQKKEVDDIIKLGYLNKRDCKTLFNKKLGLMGCKKSNDSVEMMNKLVRDRIEEMTSGLPLAVVLLAKLLRTMDYDFSKWDSASKHIMNMNTKEDKFKAIVYLSLHVLPQEVKRCFLCTVGLPERRIDDDRLVRLWMDKGILTTQLGVEVTPKEMDQGYLEELISSGLVQSVKKHSQGDDVNSVAIHDRILQLFMGNAATAWSHGLPDEIISVKQAGTSEGKSEPARSRREESKLTGRKNEEGKLEEHLMDKDGYGVICVVGESGVGKRALVRNAYEKATVKKHFQVCIWETFPADISNSSKSNIVQQIINKLNEKDHVRYLLVVDGIMTTTLSNEIEHIFSKVRNGSKIVLMATSCRYKKHIIIQLGYLTTNDSKTLFNKKLGLRGRRTSKFRVEMMDKVRDHMEKITGRLPLAVVLLAKLLRSMDLNKWEPASQYIMDNNQDDRLKTIVSLSIDDLPDELKSCLLYTAGFPDRSVIDANDLVRLWVAEGFLSPQHGVEPEELGQRYLKELIFRGLVQLVKKRDQGDGVESVAIHDQIHRFFRSEAQRTGFMDIHYGGNVRAPDTARRLALQKSSPKLPEFIRELKKLRTVVSQNSGRDNVDSTSATNVQHAESSREEPSSKKKEPSSFLQLLRGSPFLRVIDLEGLDIGDVLPGEIGDMVHLQYLGVRGCRSLKKVPSSIGNLSKLQTLDVRGTCVTKLPRSFWKIAALRHVLGDQLLFPTSSGDIKLIQTLEKVVIARGSAWRERRLGLRLLHRLHVVKLDGSRGQDLRAVLDQLSFLESLSLSGDPIPTDFLESATLQHLVSLELNGRLLLPRNMLDVDNVPNQLTHLVLNSTHVGQGFVDMLAKLPVLSILAMLDDSYDDEELVFNSNGHGFSSLTVLRLSHLPKLKTIKEEGDMTLQKLATFEEIGMSDLSLEGAPRLSSLLPAQE